MKIYLTVALFLLAGLPASQRSCLGQPPAQESAEPEEQSNDTKNLFPISVAKPSAKAGEFGLCPSRQFYDSAVKVGIDKSTFIFYAATMFQLGDHASKVKNLAGTTFWIPNQLIVSIDPKQNCKLGDEVLTWWQSGSGMQRAIVVGGTETAPVVRCSTWHLTFFRR